MSDRTRRIRAIGAAAAYIVAIAGLVGALALILSASADPPGGALADIARLVMTAALAPLMLVFYELGGSFPLRPAQAVQTVGWLACLTSVAAQIFLDVRSAGVDYLHAASGWLAIGAWATMYIGLWIAGANLLAGAWLTSIRLVGVLAGIGTAVLGVGLLMGGTSSGWTLIGGIGFHLVLPLWALLMARHLGEFGNLGR